MSFSENRRWDPLIIFLGGVYVYAYARQTWLPKAVALDREDVMMAATIIILIIFYRSNETKVIFNFSEYLVHFQPFFIYNLPHKKNNKNNYGPRFGTGTTPRDFRLLSSPWVEVQH